MRGSSHFSQCHPLKDNKGQKCLRDKYFYFSYHIVGGAKSLLYLTMRTEKSQKWRNQRNSNHREKITKYDHNLDLLNYFISVKVLLYLISSSNYTVSDLVR